MKVDYEEESAVRKALAFEIEPDVVAQEIDKRARHYARRVRLPGFRAGKIPPGVIRQRFRREILDDVAETIVNRVVFDEIRGRGLKPVATPQVKDLKIDETAPMTFKAVFEVLPLIDVPEWRGLEARRTVREVSDEDVERELDGLREGAARIGPVEGRPLEKGDHALVDARRRPAGGGKEQRNENAVIEVGAEGNAPEIDDALVGMSVGETKTVSVAPRAAEGEDQPAGEAAEYTLTLKEIKRKVLPELDDEFAKDLGEWDTLEALRNDVRERLRAVAERDADRDLKRALVDALVAKAEIDVPDALVERHMTARTESTARGLAMQGIDPRQLQIDWREFREKQREEAAKAAKADLLLDEIARREGIDALDAEIDAELERIAAQSRKSKSALRAQMEKEGELSALRAKIREDKVLDLLKANARLAGG